MEPPRFKPKLPRFLSFPIGFEAVKTALHTVPIFNELELSFSKHSVLSSTKFRKIVESECPYTVLTACFVRWGKSPSFGDDPWIQANLRGRWTVWLYPCARESKATAKAAILTNGLPKIAQWLSEERPETWYSGRKSCEVIFIPKEKTVKISEKDGPRGRY